MSYATQQKYRKNGKCIRCGKRPPRNQRLSCLICAKKEKAQARRSKSISDKMCVRCGSKNLITKAHCADCRIKHNNATIKRYNEIRDKVFAAYGGYICNCCGETEPSFLSIDHVNNDGAEHGRKIGNSYSYRWLLINNFPSGFQVLCMNCQWGKKNNNGVCLHEIN